MLGAPVEVPMRPRILFASILILLGSAPAVPAQSRFVWPDPVERTTLLRRELERESGFARTMRRPADNRSLLQDRYDVLHYRLDLAIRDLPLEWIRGDLTARVRVTAGPIDTLLLDLRDSMPVDSVFVDGRPAGFTQAGYDLVIVPATPLAQGAVSEAHVFYQGHPVETGEVSFTFGSRGSVPTIWTLSEPFGAREWWPCKDRPDDKADSVDVIVRVPEFLFVTSNGTLVSNTLGSDELRVFHWKHRYPITTYLVCLNATNYVRLDDRYVAASGDTLPLEHFVYPEKVAQAREDFSITPAAIGFFETVYGPYPFMREKYGHTIFPWGGGMEHQTNTSYGAGLVRGDHAYDYILVHELAHQWWGDMTSPADWRDIWLNEGFASYGEAQWVEHREGKEALQQYMTQVQYVGEPSGRVYDPVDLFDASVVYNKGAWVLHMLRGVLGDSLYQAVFDEYRVRTAYRSTTTEEFRAIAEEIAHRDLGYFFEPWVYGNGRPSYAVSFQSVGEPGLPRVAVHLAQTQTQQDLPYFPMPVDLRVNLEGGGFETVRVFNDPDHEDFEFDLPIVPSSITVDPDSWILKFATSSAYGLNITTTDLPATQAGDSVRVQLTGRGGAPPYEWSMVNALPLGMALEPATGLLHGTAPDSGLYLLDVLLGDHAGASDTQRYRWQVTPEPPDTTVVPIPGPLALKIGPNPAGVHADFYLTGPAGASVVLSIYDLRGREVRRLWDDAIPARAIPWDGRDDRGNRVASGIYFCRLTGPGDPVTRRIVWLR
jgi:aminopeptidase N